jgi:hypothetical protein
MRNGYLTAAMLLVVGSASIGATEAVAVNFGVQNASVLVVDETPRPDGCFDRRSTGVAFFDSASTTVDFPQGTYVLAYVYEQVRCGTSYSVGQFALASFDNPVPPGSLSFAGVRARVDAVVPALVLVDGVEVPTSIHIDVAVEDRPPADPRTAGTWTATAVGTVTTASGDVLADFSDVVWTGDDPDVDELAMAATQRSDLGRILGPPPILWSEIWRREAVGYSAGQCRDATGLLVGTWEVTAWRTGLDLAGVYARVDAACERGIEFLVTTFDSTQPDGTVADEDAATFVALPGSDLFAGPAAVNALGSIESRFETFGVIEHSGDPCTGVASAVDFVIESSTVTSC